MPVLPARCRRTSCSWSSGASASGTALSRASPMISRCTQRRRASRPRTSTMCSISQSEVEDSPVKSTLLTSRARHKRRGALWLRPRWTPSKRTPRTRASTAGSCACSRCSPALRTEFPNRSGVLSIMGLETRIDRAVIHEEAQAGTGLSVVGRCWRRFWIIGSAGLAGCSTPGPNADASGAEFEPLATVKPAFDPTGARCLGTIAMSRERAAGLGGMPAGARRCASHEVSALPTSCDGGSND